MSVQSTKHTSNLKKILHCHSLPIYYHTTCEKTIMGIAKRCCLTRSYHYHNHQTDRSKQRQILACMHGMDMVAVVASMERKRSPTHQHSPLTHGIWQPRPHPTTQAGRLMIKTWIHGQLLSLLYSRNMSKTPRKSNLPAPSEQSRAGQRQQSR